MIQNLPRVESQFSFFLCEIWIQILPLLVFNKQCLVWQREMRCWGAPWAECGSGGGQTSKMQWGRFALKHTSAAHHDCVSISTRHAVSFSLHLWMFVLQELHISSTFVVYFILLILQNHLYKTKLFLFSPLLQKPDIQNGRQAQQKEEGIQRKWRQV